MDFIKSNQLPAETRVILDRTSKVTKIKLAHSKLKKPNKNNDNKSILV